MSRIVKSVEAESRLMVTRDRAEKRMGSNAPWV